jgi:hypothetical protein
VHTNKYKNGVFREENACIQFAHKKAFFRRFGEGKVCMQEIRGEPEKAREWVVRKQGQTGKESNEGARSEGIFTENFLLIF